MVTMVYTELFLPYNWGGNSAIKKKKKKKKKKTFPAPSYQSEVGNNGIDKTVPSYLGEVVKMV